MPTRAVKHGQRGYIYGTLLGGLGKCFLSLRKPCFRSIPLETEIVL